MGDTNSDRVFPNAGFVFRICAPTLVEQPPAGSRVEKHGGFFTFYCTSFLPLAECIESQDVFVPDVKQSDRFSFMVTYRRPQGKVRFRADAVGLQVDQYPIAPWMGIDEKQAEAELDEMSASPYANDTSEFFLKIRESFTRVVDDSAKSS